MKRGDKEDKGWTHRCGVAPRPGLLGTCFPHSHIHALGTGESKSKRKKGRRTCRQAQNVAAFTSLSCAFLHSQRVCMTRKVVMVGIIRIKKDRGWGGHT